MYRIVDNQMHKQEYVRICSSTTLKDAFDNFPEGGPPSAAATAKKGPYSLWNLCGINNNIKKLADNSKPRHDSTRI